MQRPPHIRRTAKGRLSQKKGGLCLQFGDNCRYNKNGKGARRKAHILVAEDEVPIREVVSRHLLLVGHTVAQAGTGPQAVEMCGKELILLDVMLPGMDGFEVKRRLPACGLQFRCCG